MVAVRAFQEGRPGRERFTGCVLPFNDDHMQANRHTLTTNATTETTAIIPTERICLNLAEAFMSRTVSTASSIAIRS